MESRTAAGRPLLLTTTADLDALRSSWDALAARSGNVFASWEWARAWWRQFGAGRELSLRVDAHEPSFILPLCREAAGELRFLGHGDSDHLGPICAAATRPEAAAALRALAAHAGPLVADDLPGGQDWPRLVEAEPSRRTPTPLLHLAGLDWEGFLASRSRNFRAQVRARERRLLRAHDVRVRLTDATRLEADMSALVALHDARWAGQAGTFRGPREALQREFARAALERGWLALRLLECDGHPIAALYAFRYAGAEWYYQAGRDPAWDRWSPGFVLLCAAIRDAMDKGLSEYRLLRGGEAYQSRFADADPGTVTIRLERLDCAREGGAGAIAGSRSTVP
ncbi:MAG TPA: GNAT family N-acetyltransferase [Thermoleophilaceae bacterium]